jgi:hypothetical protein
MDKKAEKRRTLDLRQARELKRAVTGRGEGLPFHVERALAPEIDTVRGYAQRRATRGG